MAKKDAGGPDNNKEKKRKKKVSKRCSKAKQTVDHSIVARWVQEQILTEIPELGYISESLIKRVLKTAHRYYIEQGYKTIRLSDK